MKRILLVDDDVSVRDLLAELLRGKYAISMASNGAEALDLIRVQPPDAIVLDMRMPVMNGWTFLAALGERPPDEHIPVIVVSAEPAACEDGRRLGADACMPKPFDVDEFADAVDQLFNSPVPDRAYLNVG